METVTIRVQRPTEDERALINILSVEERLAALIEAAAEKVARLPKGKKRKEQGNG